ncbi:MAG TPA: hypothetical protein VM573_03120 [Actinomycetota bacterium]|nr:hypothetical protein [Actinomycetota bacterium]
MRCEEIQTMLPAFADEKPVQLGVRRHLARCADCRAELDRYEALAGGLAALATTTAEPPAALLPALVDIPARRTRIEEARSHVARNRKRYLGGLAGAIAVAGAAVALRSRRVAAA